MLERIGPVAYKLELLPSSKIHPVFHVSLLKKAVQTPTEPVLPPELEVSASDLLVLAAILASRLLTDHNEQVRQWLIQWKGCPIEDATWEDAVSIQSQFPEASLEDKTFSEGGSNDEKIDILAQQVPSPRVLQVYSRRANQVSG